jgi:hypothetical protein
MVIAASFDWATVNSRRGTASHKKCSRSATATAPLQADQNLSLVELAQLGPNGSWRFDSSQPHLGTISSSAYFFLALHFWTDVELLLEPSEKLSVATSVHFFFLHRAMT